MSPIVRKRYVDEKVAFIQENNKDNQLYEFEFLVDVPFTFDRTLVYEEKLGGKPWYANDKLMVLLDLLVIGWIQRIFIEYYTHKVKY